MLREGERHRSLNTWTHLSACRSAFSSYLIVKPLRKTVHEAARGTGLLVHVSTSALGFFVLAPLECLFFVILYRLASRSELLFTR